MTVSKLTHGRIDRFPNLSLTLRRVIFEDAGCHESILPVVLANCFEKLLSITGRKDQIASPIRFPSSSSKYFLACVADVIQPRLVGTLRSEDGDGRENVAEKVNSCSFILHRDYSKSLTFSSVGEPS